MTTWKDEIIREMQQNDEFFDDFIAVECKDDLEINLHCGECIDFRGWTKGYVYFSILNSYEANCISSIRRNPADHA